MENYKKIYKNICRLCLKQGKSDKMVCLFEKSGRNGLSRYGESVVSVVHILLEKSDKYPVKMCEECSLLLKQAVSFKNRCERSDIRLKTLANSSTCDEMIQQIVECSLFWEYFPEKITHQGRSTPPSAAEESLILQSYDSCNIEFDDTEKESTNQDEADCLLNIMESTNKKALQMSQSKIQSKNKNLDINSMIKSKFICQICQQSFFKKTTLKYHLKKHELNIDKDPDLFLDIMQRYLKGRISKQSSKKERVTCNVCKKVLSSKNSLIVHIKRHATGDYICEQCGKTYVSNKELQVHLLATHNTGAGFKCDYCDMKLLTYFNLKEHTRIHTGERPFTCEKCGLSFRRQYIYNKHLLLHGEKTVKCPECPRMFYRKSDLYGHRNNVHERRYMYVCSECGAMYAKNTTVRKHLTDRHGIPRELQGKITKISKNSAQVLPSRNNST